MHLFDMVIDNASGVHYDTATYLAFEWSRFDLTPAVFLLEFQPRNVVLLLDVFIHGVIIVELFSTHAT